MNTKPIGKQNDYFNSAKWEAKCVPQNRHETLTVYENGGNTEISYSRHTGKISKRHMRTLTGGVQMWSNYEEVSKSVRERCLSEYKHSFKL